MPIPVADTAAVTPSATDTVVGYKATAASTKKVGKGAARSAKSTADDTDKENTHVSHLVHQHILLTESLFALRLSAKQRVKGSLGPVPTAPLPGELE